jgi:DNA repair protein RadC
MKVKEYTTELDVDKKNVLREVGHYVIVKEKYNNPQKFADFAREKLRLDKRAEEYVYILGLTNKNHILSVFEICHGNIRSSMCGAREIFIRLLLSGAAQFVMIHNHPSGDTSPSDADCQSTQRLIDAGKLMGIPMVDSIIIGDVGHLSIREEAEAHF